MKISIPCPGSILTNVSILHPEELAAVNVEGGLLSFEIRGESLDERLTHLAEMEAHVGGLIADADEAELIYALGHLKASLAGVRPVVVRESSYTLREENYLTRAAEEFTEEVAEATNDLDVSQLHVQSHTSIDESSEQHGVAPLNEEIEIEQAEEKGSGLSGYYGRVARADGD